MLTIRLLGDLTLLRGGHPLPLPPSRKTRALLAYLVATGRPQRRDRLCDLLWELPDDPRGALRWSLSKLRALVDEPAGGPARILAGRETVAFALEGATCDLDELRAVAKPPGALAAQPLDRLRTVAEAIGGEFLEGLDLPAQPDFQAWCLAEREDARRMRAALLRELVARRTADAPEDALAHARTLVALDAFDAAARGMLIELLGRLGRRAEAEQQVEAGLQALREADLPAGAIVQAARSLRATPPGGRPGPEPGHGTGPAAAPRVLVVDGEPDLAEAVAAYLLRNGLAAQATASGAGLDAMLAEQPADLVLLDVNMPEEDGFSIARRLRGEGAPKLLFLTAAGSVAHRVAGFELGAEDYITKPFDLREVLARVQVALRRPQLTAAAPPMPPVEANRPVPAAAAGSERKRVTVLLAVPEDEADDDPEIMARRLDAASDVLRASVARHGGRITAAGPAGIAAVFGAPVAQEDDAVAACFAALDAQAAALDPAFRFGLHGGEMLVRPTPSGADPGAIEAVGGVIGLAARIGREAPPGGIAASPEVVRAAEGFVIFEPMPAGRLAMPLAVATGRAPPRSRWDVRAARGLTRFAGREAEVAELERAMRRVAAGRAEAVSISGEPGVGKSRLAHECLDALVPPDWAVLTTAAMPQDAGAAYRPVDGLLRAWLGIGARETRAAMAARLSDRIETAYPALRPHRAALASLLDLPEDDPAWAALSPGLKRRTTQDAVRALLALESARQPLVVLVEDLHWADAETLAALDAVVEGLGGQPLLLLATHRPEHRPAWLGRRATAQIHLEPLQGEATEALLDALLGCDPSLAPLRRDLSARTGGVPLFLEEAVRELAESGALQGAPGDYRAAAGSAVAAELPVDVRAVLAARIDRLPPAAKSLLQTASVVGRDVPIAVLERVSGLDAETLQETLAELRGGEFLFETRLPPDAEYAFKHAMTQEAAYGGLPLERRRAIHLRTLQALQELHAGRLEEQVDRLAHHAAAAEQWPEAVEWLGRAAGRAALRSAHAQASELLCRGLQALAQVPASPDRLRQELACRKALGTTLMALKGWGAPEVAAALTRTQEIAEQLGDERELFAALRGQGQFHMIRGEVGTARGFGLRCTAIAARSAEPEVAVETHHLFWSNSFFRGDFAEVLHHADAGLAIYRRDRDHRLAFLYSGHDPATCACYFRGLSLWQVGRAEEALQGCRRAVAMAEEMAHPLTTALAQWAMAFVHLLRGEAEEARRWAERQIALSREFQLALLLHQGELQLGWALSELDAPEEGIVRLKSGLAGVQALGAEMGLPWFVAVLGEAEARAGRPEEGLAEVGRALAMARRHGAHLQLPEMLRLKGEMLQMLGDAEEAQECLREAIHVARAQGAKAPETRASARLRRLDGCLPQARGR